MLTVVERADPADGRDRSTSTPRSPSTSCWARPRPLERRVVLSNSFGFGGHNGTRDRRPGRRSSRSTPAQRRGEAPRPLAGDAPSSIRRTMAVAHDDAVGDRAAAAACAGDETPMPRQIGSVVRPRSARRARAPAGRASARLARRGHAADGVEEALGRARTARRAAPGGVDGAASSTVSIASRVRGACHGVELLERQVGQDRAGDPGGGERRRGAVVAARERRRCGRSWRRAGPPRCPRAASSSTTDASVVPRSSARVPAAWMTGPSMIGSENGSPTSSASTPASTSAAAVVEPVVGAPGHEVGDAAACGRQRAVRPARRRAARRAGAVTAGGQEGRDVGHVLVATTGQADEHRGTGGDGAPRLAQHPRDGVRGLERRDDPLGAREALERVEHLVVGGRAGTPRARSRRGRRARARRPGSRGPPRSSAPRGSGRRRPAGAASASRAARPGTPLRSPHRPPARRRRAARACRGRP